MHLDKLCSLEFRYLDAHFPKPYGDESGISTTDGAKVLVSFTGRTVFVPRGNETVGRQLLMALFESDDERYAWLNSEVCIAEGIHDPQNPPSHTEVYLCTNDLM